MKSALYIGIFQLHVRCTKYDKFRLTHKKYTNVLDINHEMYNVLFSFKLVNF
eukprot:UN18256